MNVLWIAYQPIPVITKQLSIGNGVVTGGWLQGAADIILCNKEIELSYCFPCSEILEGDTGGLHYYTIRKIPEIHFRDRTGYRRKDFDRFRYIIDKCEPDIIHIFGTETIFQRQFVQMAYDMGLISKTIVWIQGLVSICAKRSADGLSNRQLHKRTFMEFIKRTNMADINNRLKLNGIGERRVINILKNVFIRTDWDTANCKAINNKLNFYHCNETLRNGFYGSEVWELARIRRHSIFFSQYAVPLKGFHKLLKALSIILREYPDTMVYTTGKDLFHNNHQTLSSYEKLLKQEIIRNDIKEHIVFLGVLDEYKMRDQYINAHVFVSASSIENSPNSVAEAMILGAPVVASDVGGVSSMLAHNVDGLLYPFEEEALLADYVCRIFGNDELAVRLSENARKHALITHDREQNYSSLIAAYRQIIKNSGEMA